MPLTATAIVNAKPTEKPRKLFDSGGLFLLVQPSGAKWWRFRYRFDGKEKLLSLGTYPDVSLKDARERRDSARQQLADGIDPSLLRRAEKAARTEAGANSFEAVALEWFAKQKGGWADSHSGRILRRLKKDLFPWLWERPISEITPAELLAVLRRIEGRGAVDTAHRAKHNAGQIFRYAVATGRAERDIAADLKDALTPVNGGQFASVVTGQDPRVDEQRVGELLRAIDGYGGTFPVCCALQLAPLVFVRPGELRHAEWSEFDLDAAEWRIPAARMKGSKQRKKIGQPHLVPLATQAIAILQELQPLTGNGQFLFPSIRTADRAMSENTLNGALRRLGYDSQTMTAHGFRAMASTLLNQQGWHRDAIERQLAHIESNTVRAAYDRAAHLDERRRMMQAWADYLGGLRAGAVVTPIGIAKKG